MATGRLPLAVGDPHTEAFEALRSQACLARLEWLRVMHRSAQPVHLTFLHGQPGAGSDWSAVIDRLPDSCAVLAGDRPGYGSNKAGPGDFSANARFVLSELDAAEVAETVLVGHSYGGGVALTVAAMAPERVRALVLVSSVGRTVLTAGTHSLLLPWWGRCARYARGGLLRGWPERDWPASSGGAAALSNRTSTCTGTSGAAPGIPPERCGTPSWLSSGHWSPASTPWWVSSLPCARPRLSSPIRRTRWCRS